MTLADELDERGPDGLLTPWALACGALRDGCGCDYDEPGTCLGCLCEAAMRAERKRAEKAEAERRDLAMLVRCLASRLHKVAPGTSLAKRARDYLFRKGLAGSPLRAETAEPDVSEAASHE